jgi:hypothetical protein
MRLFFCDVESSDNEFRPILRVVCAVAKDYSREFAFLIPHINAVVVSGLPGVA